MNSGSTVAPKERINITYKPAVGNAKESVELPFKVSVLGDFSLKGDDRSLEEREPINLTAQNFDEVMEEHELSVSFTVPNAMIEDPSAFIDVDLNIKSLKDLTPDNIIRSVPELQEIFRIREALQSLKGPLGNNPKMRKMIQSLISDESSRKALIQEVGPLKPH